jgi:ABC-type transporter MlaC component
MEGRSSRRGARPWHAFLSGQCRVDERGRYRARPLRRAAQHDEERPDTGPKRAFHTVGAGYSPNLRHRVDGTAFIGPSWTSLSDAQRQEATESFGRYISAIYADRFDSYNGQKLEVTGEQPAPSGVMVRSQIIKASGEPVKVDYIMRRNGDGWLISDIYLDGAISEVATRRSEFAAILRTDGIDGLIAALNRKADSLTGTMAKAL